MSKTFLLVLTSNVGTYLIEKHYNPIEKIPVFVRQGVVLAHLEAPLIIKMIDLSGVFTALPRGLRFANCKSPPSLWSENTLAYGELISVPALQVYKAL